MIRHVLTINHQTHLLLDGEQLERVKHDVLDAVHDNGGFVEIATGAGSSVEELVTPGSAVTFEHIWVEDEDPSPVPEAFSQPEDFDGSIDPF
jgi:hypothetical protein